MVGAPRRIQDPLPERDSLAGSLKKISVHVAEEGISSCLFRVGEKVTARGFSQAL